MIAARYPRIFPTTVSEQSCSALSPFLTVDDQNFLNSAADRLDNVLAGAAGEAGVNFVDVRSSFDGHGVCGKDGAWINGISFASGNDGACTWELLGQCVITGLNPVGSFHPNATGHANGYAPAFQTFISQASNRTAEGMPANPNPLMSISPMAETITPLDSAGVPLTAKRVSTPPWLDSFADLPAIPVTASSAACEGTFQAGQQVEVNAAGFAPGASVKVVGAGTGIDNHAAIATLTADQNGAVSGTVRIPLTGFTPNVAKAGAVFLDALGIGADGTHRDANAMVGLVPHGNQCGTVEALPFKGFQAPVADAPAVNKVQPGSAVPVKFSLPGSSANLAAVLSAGYPVSVPTSCTSPDPSVTTGEPAAAADNGDPAHSDTYNYAWKTDPAWSGCRELIMKLVDGTYHRALFEFRP